MKWGQRRWQNSDGTFNEAGKARYFGKSAGGNVRRALAGAYGVSERVYSKLGNKTLASMNKAAKEQMLEKAAKADQRKADHRQEKINAKNQKTAEKDAEINKRINSAKNSSEMESAMQKKVKEDLRRSQNPLSRTLNDISGYNNSIANQVVEVNQMIYYEDNYLEHHGILGQKWGIRRFQNADGSLTNAGKKRYSSEELRSMAKQVGEYNIGKSKIRGKAVLERRKADDKYDRESSKLYAQRDKMSKRDYDKAFDKLGKELDSNYKASEKKAAESEKKLVESLKEKYGIDVDISTKEIQRNPIRTAIALAGQKKAESIISENNDYRIPKGAKTDGSSDYQPRRPKGAIYN